MLPPLVRRRSLRLRLASVLAVVGALLVTLGPAPSAQAAAMPSKQQWWSDVSAALRSAQSRLDDRVDQRRSGEKLAINLDIDNTAIETHYAWPHATPQVLKLVQSLNRRGVFVLINTGRPTSDLPRMKKVLTAAGYHYSYTCGHKAGLNLVEGKQACRRLFLQRGYTLIANIGNNGSDFQGAPHAEQDYRLPDYGGRLS